MLRGSYGILALGAHLWMRADSRSRCIVCELCFLYPFSGCMIQRHGVDAGTESLHPKALSQAKSDEGLTCILTTKAVDSTASRQEHVPIMQCTSTLTYGQLVSRQHNPSATLL